MLKVSETFSSLDEFENALEEVKILLSCAKEREEDATRYSLFNKSAILFLTSKFESFLENTIEEHSYRISQSKPLSSQIPKLVKLHISKFRIDNDFMHALRQEKETAAITLSELSQLWNDSSYIEKLNINSKFDYGKHGEAEIIRLFRRVGIENIFLSCPVYEQIESLNEETSTIQVEIQSDVNALIGYRNYIIHNDGSPNITHEQIENYVAHLLEFAREIEKCLQKELTFITGNIKSQHVNGE